MGLIVVFFSESERLLETMSFIVHSSHSYEEKRVCVCAPCRKHTHTHTEAGCTRCSSMPGQAWRCSSELLVMLLVSSLAAARLEILHQRLVRSGSELRMMQAGEAAPFPKFRNSSASTQTRWTMWGCRASAGLPIG